jgi:hypothetical protein
MINRVNRSWELGTKFQKAGDINKASDGVRQEDFKMMSHDLVIGIMKLKSWEEFSLNIIRSYGCNLELRSPVISSGV